MGQISIRLTDRDELFLKQEATENQQSLAEFCRDKILRNKPRERPLERITIEAQIEKLENEINRMSRNMDKLAKMLLHQSIMNGTLCLEVVDIASNNENEKINAYNIAKRNADTLIQEAFGEP